MRKLLGILLLGTPLFLILGAIVGVMGYMGILALLIATILTFSIAKGIDILVREGML